MREREGENYKVFGCVSHECKSTNVQRAALNKLRRKRQKKAREPKNINREGKREELGSKNRSYHQPKKNK